MAESPRSASTPATDTSTVPSDATRHALLGWARRVVGPTRPPHRPTAIRFLVAGLVVATVSWYFRADVWHSILLGGVLATVGLVVSTHRSVLDRPDTNWRGGEVRHSDGARNDVAELSWSLRAHYRPVGHGALRRVQQLARTRLAMFGLDVRDPADRPRIERLIGRRAFAVLATNQRRPPYLRSLLHCLDALDSLNTSRPTELASKPRRRYLILANHPRRTRAR